MGQVANEDRCGAQHQGRRCVRPFGHTGHHLWNMLMSSEEKEPAVVDEEAVDEEETGCTVIHLYGARTVRVYSVADFELLALRHAAQAENGAWLLFGLLAALALVGMITAGITGKETYGIMGVVAAGLLLLLVAVSRWSSVAKEVKRIEESAKFEE